MIITKIHRILTFKQSPWLKVYIDFNTRCRSESTTELTKDFYKLMNNSVFGKSQENLRNRVNLEVVTNRDVALKRICKPSFKRSQRIREDLVIMETSISNLKLNKPVYIGFSVLDLSKLLIYEFHYEKMMKKYSHINLCFTDTDSLLYKIETLDIYQYMYEAKDDYDYSEYPTTHPCCDPVNKKIIGKFKDELNSRTLEEFIGLRPKCYSLLFNGKVKKNKVISEDLEEKQTAKGTTESAKKRYLRRTQYKNVLTNLSIVIVKQNVMKSKSHTKRWIGDDNIHALAHGHVKTSEEKNEEPMNEINWSDAKNEWDIDIL